MRRAGGRLAQVFFEITPLIKAGTTTREIDAAFEEQIRACGGRPAFKGYKGAGARAFPASTCISIDREVVHGIPSDRRLKVGQIVGIDAGIELDGWFGDMACSFLIGDVAEDKRRLWSITREALYKGIARARAGNRVKDIGAAVEDWAVKHGFSIIRELVGHGIGSDLHESPQIPNYRSSEGSTLLRQGMTLAIEPMVSMGDWQIKILKDGWTAVTIDGSPSGHFEHTVLVTDGDPEILTLLDDGRDPWDLV